MPSASATNYQTQKFLDLLLKGTAYTPPTSLWIALFTTTNTIGYNGSGFVEVSTSGTAYAREEISTSVVGWTGPTVDGNNFYYANTADIVWEVPTANWGTVTGLGLYDASTAGNLLYFAQLSTSKTVSLGDGAPRIQAGAMRISRALC